MNLDNESVIRQGQPADKATVSSALITRHGEGEIMATGVLINPPRSYVAAMTTSANSVIAAIDIERPGLRPGKKLLLLFFAQGHHLADHDKPLFSERLYATDRTVGIDGWPFAGPAAPPTDPAHLDAIGYAVERYSLLKPADLRALIQVSSAWQNARRLDGGDIDLGDLRDWFTRTEETDDPDDERPNSADALAAAAMWAGRDPD